MFRDGRAENSPTNGMHRCRICVLPKTVAKIEFDGDGTCSLCQETKGTQRGGMARPSMRQGKFPGYLERIREAGRGRPYDALVGLSGGRDSSYMAYLVARKYGLRLLGAYYRTPFTPDLSDANVRRISSKLNIPLVEISIPWELHIEAARRFFLLWLQEPRPEYASLSCAVCKIINKKIFQIAEDHDVKAIIYAGNPFENVQFLAHSFKPVGHVHGFVSATIKMSKIFTKGLGIVQNCPIRLIPIAIGASMLYVNPHTPYLQLRYNDIHRLDFFHYEPWSENECVKTIRDHLDWRVDSHAVETWKADCEFAHLKNYMFLKQYGATYNDALYSNLIRAGQLTREEAKERIRAGAGLSIECIHRVMSIMGLSKDLIDHRIIEESRGG